MKFGKILESIFFTSFSQNGYKIFVLVKKNFHSINIDVVPGE